MNFNEMVIMNGMNFDETINKLLNCYLKIILIMLNDLHIKIKIMYVQQRIKTLNCLLI